MPSAAKSSSAAIRPSPLGADWISFEIQYWNIGILEYSKIVEPSSRDQGRGRAKKAILEYWDIGRLEYWNIGILEYCEIVKASSRATRDQGEQKSEYWNIGILEDWKIGRLEDWKIEILEYWNTQKLSAVLPWTFSGGGGGVRWMFANLDLAAHKASQRKDDIECKPLKRSGGSFDNTLAALC